MLTTPSPLISTAEPAGYPFPQLLCDENQIQNAHPSIPIHVSGRQQSLHGNANFMRSCRDEVPGGSTKLKVLQCQACFTSGFRLEHHLKQDPGAASRLG